MKKTFFLLAVILMSGLGTASSVYAYQGYEEGRRWGMEQGITDTEYHSDDTSAFAEGVRQAAKENRQQRAQAE